MNIKQRLEELRSKLNNENISQQELIELESLAEHIDVNDVQLLEAANVPENLEERAEFFRKRTGLHSPTPWFYYDDGEEESSSHIIQATMLGEKYDLFAAMHDVDPKERTANMKFVLAAVNNHAKLIQSLQMAVNIIEHLSQPDSSKQKTCEVVEELDSMRELLSKLI